MLLAASYYFYMVWRVEYILLIVISTLIDYFAAILMERQDEKKKKRIFLILSLCTNLGLLFVFKYFNFFNTQLGRIYMIFGFGNYFLSDLKFLLPVGISFYTFQTLSYTIDVYRGERKAERHLGYFALYVSYFPQLVAGPIERSTRLLPQLKKKSSPNYKNIMEALVRICWGMLKKVVIADRAAVLVNTVFANFGDYHGLYLVLAAVAFAIQIYCDFSAYSDIAIGSAKLMGVELMENFNLPYFAKSISDFWSRWHISLSTWFRDYLYIPLGGNRVKKIRNYFNLMIVFIVSGLWHGANWTFILWGMLHGAYLIIEKIIKNISGRMGKLRANIKIPLFFKQVFVFLLVLIGWVFFRIESIHYIIPFFTNVFSLSASSLTDSSLISLGLDIYDLYVLGIMVIALYAAEALRYYSKKPMKITSTFAMGMLSILLILVAYIFGYYGQYDATQFIYFQF